MRAGIGRNIYYSTRVTQAQGIGLVTGNSSDSALGACFSNESRITETSSGKFGGWSGWIFQNCSYPRQQCPARSHRRTRKPHFRRVSYDVSGLHDVRGTRSQRRATLRHSADSFGAFFLRRSKLLESCQKFGRKGQRRTARNVFSCFGAERSKAIHSVRYRNISQNQHSFPLRISVDEDTA